MKYKKMVLGWINYFRIGMMKGFMEEFGAWLRHKIREIVIKHSTKSISNFMGLRGTNLYKNMRKGLRE